MKPNKLGASFNIFSLSSQGNKLKNKFSIHDKISSSKVILPLHMSLAQRRRGQKRKSTKEHSHKKTNRILRLYKKNPKTKALERMKSEINRKIFAKYVNPYMNNIHHILTPFSKEKKVLYYDYYQICYIFNKMKCDLYSKYKDYKLLYDNQEYFLKFFKRYESKAYLNYLLYVTYNKDSSVKSTRVVSLKKDIDKIKSDYKEYIIKNVFEAKRLIFSRDVNKYIPNISSKIFDPTQQKLSRIAIPKYQLIIKPILVKRINYYYIKDVPIIKIPKTIPNYSNFDKNIYILIKNYLLKKKFSILIINGRKVPKKLNSRRNLSREISHDYNILNSVKTNSLDDLDNDNNSNLLYLSRYLNDYNNNALNNNKRKNNKEINDIENLLGKMSSFKNEELNVDEKFDEIINKNNNSENLNTIYENDDEVFLSTLKKPFIGNRDKKKIKIKNDNVKNRNEIIDNKNKFKSENDLVLLYNMTRYKKKETNKKNKKFKLYLDLNRDDLNCLNEDDKNNKGNKQKENIFKNYFSDRFINPKKYKEYLVTSPFLKSIVNMHIASTPNKNLENNKKEINMTSNSSEKSNINLFKATYKFLLEFNKKERREEIVNDLINKSNKIYKQIKTMTDMEKNKINFKKSGAFTFTSFKGINFLDKIDNEWDLTENYFNFYKNHTFQNSMVMKKINRANLQKEKYFKNCITSKEILKSPNIYL